MSGNFLKRYEEKLKKENEKQNFSNEKYQTKKELSYDKKFNETATKQLKSILEMWRNKKKYNDEIREKIIELIEQGADFNVEDCCGYSVLIHAVYKKDVELTKFLINMGIDVNTKSGVNYTPLMCAVKNKDFEIAEILIENGAELNAINDYGETALIRAVYGSNLEMVKFLVENGADINAHKYPTAIIVANKIGEEEIYKYLYSQLCNKEQIQEI